MAAYSSRQHASSVVDENKKALPVKAHAAAKGITVGVKASAALSSRRVLSEVGNIVQATAELKADKENLKAHQGSHVVTRAASKRTAAAVPRGQAKPLEAKPRAASTARAATVKGSDAAETNHAVPGVATRKVSGPVAAKHQRSVSVDSAAPVVVVVVEDEVANAVLPAGANLKAVPEVAAELPEIESSSDPKRMSLTASLTSRSEEACGGVQDMMMDAEESVPDIDAEDHSNPLAVTQYVEDIYAFYRKTEKQSMVAADYMKTQPDINDKMRGILIDWLVEVHLKFKLMPETLYLTINLIDRFLAVSRVSRKNLQLVGVTAMLVASKYEEIWAPEVKDFVYISDNAYNKDQILGMEKLMLNTLQFNLTIPTPYVFAARFLKAANTSDKIAHTLTWFLLELCLPDYSMLRFSPSQLAAAAVYTALLTAEKGPSGEGASSTSKWSACLKKHSGYSESQLLECARLMVALHEKTAQSTLTAVHKKYSSVKFLEVSRLPPATLPADA